MVDKNSRILIFGASGFVGGGVSKKLKEKFDRVIEVSSQKIDLLSDESIELVEEIVQPGDIIVFISAKAPCKNGKDFLENIKMVNNFLAGINLKRNSLSHLIYVSSDAVFSDSMSLIHEESLRQPDNLHGLMHVLRESMFEKSVGDKLAIVRPTLIYGFDDPHGGYGPNLFWRKAKDNAPILLFGNGEELRDHVSIDDVADSISLCLEKRFLGTTNLVSGETISFFEIAEMFRFKFNIEVICRDRTSPMPHNGYRAFEKSSLCSLFKFEFQDAKKGISKAFFNNV